MRVQYDRTGGDGGAGASICTASSIANLFGLLL